MKTTTIQSLLICIIAWGLIQTHVIAAQGNDFAVETKQSADAFPLVHNGDSAKIVFDAGDASVVRIAAEALDKDIALVTGTRPGIYSSGDKAS